MGGVLEPATATRDARVLAGVAARRPPPNEGDRMSGGARSIGLSLSHGRGGRMREWASKRARAMRGTKKGGSSAPTKRRGGLVAIATLLSCCDLCKFMLCVDFGEIGLLTMVARAARAGVIRKKGRQAAADLMRGVPGATQPTRPPSRPPFDPLSLFLSLSVHPLVLSIPPLQSAHSLICARALSWPQLTPAPAVAKHLNSGQKLARLSSSLKTHGLHRPRGRDDRFTR